MQPGQDFKPTLLETEDNLVLDPFSDVFMVA